MAQRAKKNGSAPALRDSVEQVWLAGLGALAVTESEGTRLFRTLVKQGERFDRVTRARLDRAMKAARSAPGTAVNRVEAGFDDTMTRVLNRLGVPSRTEIKSLTRRVEGLTETLEKQPRPRTARRRRAAPESTGTT